MKNGLRRAMAIYLLVLIMILAMVLPASGKIPVDVNSQYTPLHYFEFKEETTLGPYLQFIGEDGRYYWGKVVVDAISHSKKSAVSQDGLYCSK